MFAKRVNVDVLAQNLVDLQAAAEAVVRHYTQPSPRCCLCCLAFDGQHEPDCPIGRLAALVEAW
jgi:hypothetical protein